MDEREVGEETGTNQGSEPNHWNQLAESLGASIPAEEPLESSTAPASPPEETVKRKSARDRSPKPQPPKSHWRSLASMLGIGGGVSEDEPEEEQAAEEVTGKALAEQQQPSFSAHPTLPTSAGEVAKADTLPAASAGTSWRTPQPAEEDVDDDAGEAAATTAEGSEPRGTSTSDISALGMDLPPDEEDINRSKAQSVLESLFQPTPNAFWEEVEAREEEQAAIRFERQEDVEFVDEETRIQRESADVDERTERTGRGRRGRTRRRRRGRAREVSSADVLDSNFPEDGAGTSDSMLRLEASAELFDKTVEEQEFERKSEYESVAKMDQREPSADRSREKKRITSWEEAISVIVERNLQNRPASNSSGGSPRAARGRRRH